MFYVTTFRVYRRGDISVYQQRRGTHLVAIAHFLSNWPMVGPRWSLHDLWTQQWVTLYLGVILIKFGGQRTFLNNLNSVWPLMTPAWPLTPAIYYALVILPTKFSGHRPFLSDLTSGWCQMTCTWRLTLAMHYTLVPRALIRSSSDQIWWP